MATKKKSAIYDAASEAKYPDGSVAPLAVRQAAEAGGVTDAAETLLFARALETVSNVMYEVQYAELKGRRFVPMSYEAGPLAERFTWRVWDGTTMAKLITNYATDIPMVEESAEEYSLRFYDFANGYGYSVTDLRRASATGVPLDTMKAKRARQGHELLLDDAIAFGIKDIGSFGLVNQPNATLHTLPTGSWSTSSDPQDILDDLNYLVTQMLTNSLEILSPNTILMGTAAFRLIATKAMSADNPRTVLEAFRAQNPGIAVESWTKLNTADAAGDSSRIICYRKDPEALKFQTAVDFEVHPMQQQGLMLFHPCTSRIGGVQMLHPMAVSYADNHNL